MGPWRLIDSGAQEAALNMALDVAVARSVLRGGLPPTLRLYRWRQPALSLGRFQDLKGISTEALEGIPLVRRPTGGRAILHGPQELTYSFSSPYGGPFKGGLRACYGQISQALQRAFGLLGIPVARHQRLRGPRQQSPLCFRSTSFGELSAGGMKLAGSAQRRWPEGFLQQGCIPLSPQRELHRRLFGPQAEGVGLWLLAPQVDLERLKEAMIKAFRELFGIEFIRSGPTAEELSLAQELRGQYLLQPSWESFSRAENAPPMTTRVRKR